MADQRERHSRQDEPHQPSTDQKGDTGDGDTGVPAEEQGISNRPGDKRQTSDVASARADLGAETDQNVDDVDDEDDEDDGTPEHEDDVTNPQSEPGKPI